MGVYTELDEEAALKAIENYEDELTKEAQQLDTLYRSFKCPRGCGPLQREIDPRHAFSDPNFLTARALLRCPNCQFLVDPHTNIVLESGNAAKIPVESSPLILPGHLGYVPLEVDKVGDESGEAPRR